MDSCPDTGIDPNLLYEAALAYISSTNWMFIFEYFIFSPCSKTSKVVIVNSYFNKFSPQKDSGCMIIANN